MKRHRNKIENDHNTGIPFDQWESMEEIIDGFLDEWVSIRLCAKAYDVPEIELREWLKVRGKLKSKKIKANLNINTIRSRLSRGMTLTDVLATPLFTPQQRAQKAALARWGK